MEHSVPQNVTSFEFHLVGDMTLKQFGYLATGLGLAYAVFATFLPAHPLPAIPLIGLFAVSGIAFAFFPISDRPLDHWALAFFRAVYSPTRGVWTPGTKGEKFNPQSPVFQNRLQNYLARIGSAMPEAAPPPPPAPVPPSPQTENQSAKMQEMTGYIQNLQNRLVQSQQEIQRLQKTLIRPPVASPVIPPPKAPAPLPQRPQVKVVAPLPQTKTQPVLTSLPNIINGIVTDTAGNYLEGVIVSIHDKNGLPVRALKTNKLGQFTGATPLPSGTYTVTFEKENLEFDTLGVTLSNEILAPLGVSAKRGGR